MCNRESDGASITKEMKDWFQNQCYIFLRGSTKNSVESEFQIKTAFYCRWRVLKLVNMAKIRNNKPCASPFWSMIFWLSLIIISKFQLNRNFSATELTKKIFNFLSHLSLGLRSMTGGARLWDTNAVFVFDQEPWPSVPFIEELVTQISVFHDHSFCTLIVPTTLTFGWKLKN